MDKKIVFFDVDGTLIDHKTNQIPKSTFEAIEQLHENGILTGLATGRSPFMLNRGDLPEFDLLVTINGQLVLYHDEILYHDPMDPDELDRLFEVASLHQIPYGSTGRYAAAVDDPASERVLGPIEANHLPIPDQDPLFYKFVDNYQGWLYATEDEMSLFEGFSFHYIRWYDTAVDVLNRGASKAFGIRKAIEKLEISMENVYALGDGLNDIEMIREVGVGIAMGNALEEVKAVADYVTEDVSNDGVAHALRHFGLI